MSAVAVPAFECADCGKRWEEGQLKVARRLFSRVEPGETMPDGECPECGALCFEADRPEDQLVPTLVAALRHLLADATAHGMAESAYSGSLIEARDAMRRAGAQP